MTNWAELTQELEHMLRLRTFPVAYKRLEKKEELDSIPRLRRLERHFTFCQLPGLVRTRGWTVGATKDDDIGERCARIHGLDFATDESKAEEAARLATTWFATVELARRQQDDYPRIPAGEAIALAPLSAGKIEPDVVTIYGLPAQLMLILNGLQRRNYERYQFHFIGEGACSDALAQCYVTEKPSLTIPCFGERRFGEVLDDELVLALPPSMVATAIDGMKELAAVGLRYPIPIHGAEHDPSAALGRAYPQTAEKRRQKAQQQGRAA